MGLGNVSGRRMGELGVTVSLWNSHVLNALSVDGYPVAWLKLKKHMVRHGH
jgi:hypothetical protein